MVTHEPLLEIRDLSVYHGKTAALRDLSLEVRAGEVVCLLGANGAGKTTLLNTISGFLKPANGTIQLRSEQISGEPPHRVFRRGVVQVSQTRDLFPDLTVLDNLELGGTMRSDGLEADLKRVFEYFPRLEERRKQRVRTLSGGEQQMVAIGRALMANPKLLLLDEPSGGLAPRFVQEIGRIMGVLKEQGATMFLVEQNIAMAIGVADRFYIIRDGAMMHSGTVDELSKDHKALAREFFL